MNRVSKIVWHKIRDLVYDHIDSYMWKFGNSRCGVIFRNKIWDMMNRNPNGIGVIAENLTVGIDRKMRTYKFYSYE